MRIAVHRRGRFHGLAYLFWHIVISLCGFLVKVTNRAWIALFVLFFD